jgi:Helix-turn-helix domain
MTQYNTILKVLESGRKLTTKQARTFGITNLSARISELRAEGYSIYTNRNSKGTHYKLGQPSREMVRLAYAIGGQDVFGGR